LTEHTEARLDALAALMGSPVCPALTASECRTVLYLIERSKKLDRVAQYARQNHGRMSALSVIANHIGEDDWPSKSRLERERDQARKVLSDMCSERGSGQDRLILEEARSEFLSWGPHPSGCRKCDKVRAILEKGT